MFDFQYVYNICIRVHVFGVFAGVGRRNESVRVEETCRNDCHRGRGLAGYDTYIT
jgi:hypothetical protein